jgi:glycolate oxidase
MSPGDALDQALARLRGVLALRDDAQVCETFSRDESDAGVFLPKAVAFPERTEQVQQLFATCQALRIPVTPVGARTGKSGGALAVRGGIALSFERMNRLVRLEPENLIAVAQPGVILAELKRAVEEKGLFYPPDPNSADSCTLGGTVAENAGGPCALKYGVTRDYVVALEWVLPSGERLAVGRKTLKGVAGYDLVGLFVGSEGTLGVATEITVSLVPKPYEISTALVSFSSVSAATLAVGSVLSSGLLPRCLELIDDVALGSIVGHGWPGPLEAKACLIIEVDGVFQESVLAELTRIADVCAAAGSIDTIAASNAEQRAQIWKVRKHISKALRELTSFKVSDDVVVPLGRLAEAVETFKEIGRRFGLLVSTYGHAGDGNLHTNVLYDTVSRRNVADEALEAILEATIALGGTITGEHGIGVSKARFLSLEQSPAVINLQRELKVLIDPGGICNPGKVFLDESFCRNK